MTASFTELEPSMSPFRIMTLLRLQTVAKNTPVDRIWGWFFYNSTPPANVYYHKPVCYTFWGYNNTKINFSHHQRFYPQHVQRIIDKKLEYNYTGISLPTLLEIWPDFQSQLKEHFLATLMSEKVFLLRSRET